jgi:hypothetical protein
MTNVHGAGVNNAMRYKRLRAIHCDLHFQFSIRQLEIEE